MAANLSPVGNGVQFFTSQGVILAGGKINTYVAGSTTRAATFTDSTQTVPNANPIILGANGMSPNPIWLSAGSQYKFVITDKNDNIIPGGTLDNLSGINDVSLAPTEWVASNVTPIYVSASSFTVPGDKTGTFTAYRRIQAVVSAGTVYGSVQSSSFSSGITTVIAVMDSTALDNGISAVSVGFLGSTSQSVPTNVRTIVPTRGQLGGLTLSTAGASATITIAAGAAADSANSVLMTLPAAISKTTSAWAVGTAAGGLDTGVIANSTWYHFYEIKRVDTGVVDVVFSLSASAPTLPANYTLYRWIAAWFLNSIGQWDRIFQDRDLFQWISSSGHQDISANNPGASAVTRTLPSVPTGVSVIAILGVQVANSGTLSVQSYFSDLSTFDQLGDDVGSARAAAGGQDAAAGVIFVRTNTSAQIRTRLNNSDANVFLNCIVRGWIVNRGQDA